MKIKVHFSRRYSVVVTILACAAAIWLMVVRFGLSTDKLVTFAWICLLFIFAVIIIAAPIAFISRWIADRRER